METTYPVYMQLDTVVEKKIRHFFLDSLLPPGQKLALSLETRTLFLLTDGPQLLVAQQLSANEMGMILPILEYFPYYCPYEVLLSYISSKAVTEDSVVYCRQLLRKAQILGMWQQELRPVRRAISSLRTKLYHFDLAVSNIRESGCCLTGLPSTARLRIQH